MKQRSGLKIFTRTMFMLLVLAWVLPSSEIKGASTLLVPGDAIRITIADPAYFTSSTGACMYHDGGVGVTICEDTWLRAFRINGSGFQFNFWTDTTRRGFLQIWVDGVQYHNLTFNYYGARNPEVTGLTPGIHEVVLRVDNTVCASASSTDCYTYPGSPNPDSFYFNTFTVLGPGDMDPPVNPMSATETHGATNGIWQRVFTMPEFTWPAGTDALSGVAGYEVYFGTDPNGTSTDFQVSTTYTTVAPYADGTYYLRLRTKDNADNYAPWVTLFTFNVDTTPPVIAHSRTGVAGAAGWWISPFTLSTTITDAHSGVATSSMSRDAGAPQPVADINYSIEGTYQVVYAAADNAGNVAGSTQDAWLDILSPELHYNIATPGKLVNGWFNGNVVLAPASTDVISGIASDQLEINGSGIWGNSVLLDTSGVYSVRQRASDLAGHTITTNFIPPDTIRIDKERPVQTVILAPSQGQAVSNAVMDFVGNSTDGASGMQAVEYQVEGGAWQPLIVTPGGDWQFQIDSETLENGLRTIAIRTVDAAGNIENWQVQVNAQNPEPASIQSVIRIFAKPTATPLPSHTPTMSPTPAPVIEEEIEQPPAPVTAPIIVNTPTPIPTEQPAQVVYEVEKQKPVNVSVGFSALPFAGLLAATVFLYDPRPAQLNKFARISQKAVPDAHRFKDMVSFVGGTLAQSNKNNKGEK
jgi:hypothetical protein